MKLFKCIQRFRWEKVSQQHSTMFSGCGFSSSFFRTSSFRCSATKRNFLSSTAQLILQSSHCVSQDAKRKFEKQTSKFCQSQERYLNLRLNKTTDVQLQEVRLSGSCSGILLGHNQTMQCHLSAENNAALNAVTWIQFTHDNHSFITPSATSAVR